MVLAAAPAVPSYDPVVPLGRITVLIDRAAPVLASAAEALVAKARPTVTFDRASARRQRQPQEDQHDQAHAGMWCAGGGRRVADAVPRGGAHCAAAADIMAAKVLLVDFPVTVYTSCSGSGHAASAGWLDAHRSRWNATGATVL